MSKLRLAINGAAGRMGKRLVALASASKDLTLVAALESPKHPDTGKDAGTLAGVQALGVLLSHQLPEGVDVVIDFSVPAASMVIGATCAERGVPLVLATTGFEREQISTIHHWATHIPLVFAPSMSMAVNLTMKLAEIAARSLKDYPEGADVEIIERHHRFKEDAPSGTALRFGELIASEMGIDQHVHGRSGRPGKRSRSEIGYHAVRTGDNAGEHTIVFGMLGETIEISVKASNRDCYAVGALAAARFVAGKPPGTYNMFDVLGL